MAELSNHEIADRLEAFAALLELAEANPFTARAYRRAAETVRGAPIAVTELVRAGRVRELRGIGPGIEARLTELIETGAIAELAELERELAPDLIGLGRYLGLGAKRSLELARLLGVRTAEEFREAAAAGRLRGVRGVGPKTEARLLEGLDRKPEPRRATPDAFETPASGLRWSVHPSIPSHCSIGFSDCRESWRRSSAAIGARSASQSRECRSN